MIKNLQEKTFKMNACEATENSIVMKRRQKPLVTYENGKTKIIDNQLFDIDGNILQSVKHSFT